MCYLCLNLMPTEAQHLINVRLISAVACTKIGFKGNYNINSCCCCLPSKKVVTCSFFSRYRPNQNLVLSVEGDYRPYKGLGVTSTRLVCVSYRHSI